ncbi:MAG: hypothetical protein MSH47_08740, partial [Bacteroidales bacterium]|nr:hypothetical protein [Bacteroidales bacterium]
SSTAKGAGGSIKGGILLHLSKADKLYANVGWYSRLPYSSVWFASGNNSITKGVKNEKNLLGEAGWRKVWSGGGLELSSYAAYWKNKSLMSNKYKAEDAEAVRYMITGLNALHIGLEATLKQKFGRVAELETFASLGRWRLLNNVEGIIYDNYTNMEIQKVSIYSDGLPVADAPQTQLGANLKFILPGDEVILGIREYENSTNAVIRAKTISISSRWVGKSIRQYAQENTDLVILIKRNHQTIIPNGETIICGNDILEYIKRT